MKFSPDYGWDDESTPFEFPKITSGVPFNLKVALWLWIVPSVLFLIGMSFPQLALISVLGVIWTCVAGMTRRDQLSQLEHLSSEPISESSKHELLSLGLPAELAGRVRMRAASEPNANSWLGTYTFSSEYWNSLSPGERVAVIKRLARPYFLAAAWQIALVVALLVPLLFFLQESTTKIFFSAYPKEDAKHYSEMIWKVPSFILPMMVYNFSCNRLLLWGDRKYVEENREVENLIGALEKSIHSSTCAKRAQQLREHQSEAVV